MFPDYWFWRYPLRVTFTLFTLLPLLVLPYSTLQLFLYYLPSYRSSFTYLPNALSPLSLICIVEAVWWFYDYWDRTYLNRIEAPRRLFLGVPEEERLPLLRAFITSDEDPWEDVLKKYFYRKDNAPRVGARDKAFDVDVTELGRDDIAEVKNFALPYTLLNSAVSQMLLHFFFNLPLNHQTKDSTSIQTEVSLMITMVEDALHASPSRRYQNFYFRPGTNPKLATLRIYDRPLTAFHRPLLFYASTVTFAQLGNLSLWLSGFKHHGHKEPFFAWYWQRGGRKREYWDELSEEERKLVRTIGYWHCRGSDAKYRKTPIVFFHGMSGSQVPSLCAPELQS